MPHTNDIMLAQLRAHYNSTAALGDLLYRFANDPDFPSGLGGDDDWQWYADRLDSEGISYAATDSLSDLVNLFWTDVDVTELVSGGGDPALLLQSGDVLLLQSGDRLLLQG